MYPYCLFISLEKSIIKDADDKDYSIDTNQGKSLTIHGLFTVWVGHPTIYAVKTEKIFHTTSTRQKPQQNMET